MKKYIILLLTLISISILVLFIVFPRKVEQGIVADSNAKQISVYVNGRLKKFKTNTKFNKLSVINFNYNLIFSYNFTIVKPVSDRVMIKKAASCDLESYGSFPLSSKVNYYTVDANSNIKPADSSSLIVGQKNVSVYFDTSSKLKTFIIYPLNYSNTRVAITTTNFTSLYHMSVKLRCLSSARLYSIIDNKSFNLSANAEVLIEQQGNCLKVTANKSSSLFSGRVYIKGNKLNLESILRGASSFAPTYSGVLEFTRNAKGILIINELPVEDYLTKVVPSEMPSYEGTEALKCQAVAARTYAISAMLNNAHADSGYYVDDSTQSQVYNNQAASASTTEAVTETKGLVIKYKGQPIDAKYYSTSCGFGAAYNDVWFSETGSNETKPYLQANNFLTASKDTPKSESEWLSFFKSTNIAAIDSKSPYFRWWIEFPESALEKSIKTSLSELYTLYPDYITVEGSSSKTLPALKTLEDIKVLKRSSSGNIIKLSFVFSNAAVDVSEDYYIRSVIRCSHDFTGITVPIERYGSDPLLSNNFLPSSFFSVVKAKGYYLFYGGGYGHGVGMSQYGAIALADNGKSFKDILKTYYKNVVIESMN